MTSKKNDNVSRAFYPELAQYLAEATAEFELIPTDRITELSQVADFVRNQIADFKPAKLIFICTHNSRRSHLAQIWAQVAAEHYGLREIETYSGGTEQTEFNPRAVAALQRCGLKISCDNPTKINPHYLVSPSDQSTPQLCFSKVYSSSPNPRQGYCAVMTCSEADKACPIVMGCELRIPIRYEDPKVADDTQFEAQRYDESCAQICREMLYMISQV